MAYTVNKLAKMSGVSIRTLRFYDQIGLLKPAYHGDNGYRFYEEEQLLMLQQILFFRELGFELKKIQEILERSDFDRIAALHSHKKVLKKDAERIKSLIETIDKTVKHLKGEKSMQDQDMYFGFSKEKQAEYEMQLIERFGDNMKKTLEESHKKTKGWSKVDWENSKQEYDEFCKELMKLMENGFRPSSVEVQEIMPKHLKWLKKFWTPTQEAYAGLGELYTEPGFQKFYEPYHPKLAHFLADSMKVFSEAAL
ncbi:MAG: MerR family transcriptional regulator [Parachlamydiaceae bacterium]|nr:MerR family transcriptional regulator [Parachlamydiaceae bacterium]